MSWADRLSRSGYQDDPPRFGGRLAMMSVVTWLLILNALVFVLDQILLGSQRGGAMAPGVWLNFNVAQGIEHFQLWRLVGYTFVHTGLLHIAFNMIGLYFFGPMVEAAIGPRRFLAFYLLSGAAGAALFTGWVLGLPGLMFPAGAAAEYATLVGASGCVMGVLIGAAMIAPDMQVMLLIPPVPMKLRTMAIVFVAVDALAVLAGSQNAGGSAAHLGGAGFAFLLFRYRGVLNVFDRLGGIGEKWRSRRSATQARRLAEVEREVDRILAKVSASGLHSLTEKEKRTLKRATQSKRGG